MITKEEGRRKKEEVRGKREETAICVFVTSGSRIKVAGDWEWVFLDRPN
jgi:hypothetical protein